MNFDILKNWTSREKIIYCAGLLEGEGSFIILEDGLRICCSMTDKQPLEILEAILGGYIDGPTPNPWGVKDKYVWYLGKRTEVLNSCKALYSFMSPRRQSKIQELYEWNLQNPRQRVDRGKVPHGTCSKYVAGCRCADCKRAQRDYDRVRRSKLVTI